MFYSLALDENCYDFTRGSTLHRMVEDFTIHKKRFRSQTRTKTPISDDEEKIDLTTLPDNEPSSTYETCYTDFFGMKIKYDKNLTHRCVELGPQIIYCKKSIKKKYPTEMQIFESQTGWYNDTIINSWMDMVKTKFSENGKCIIYLNTQAIHKMTETVPYDHYNIIDLKNKKYLVFPFNVKNQHWKFGIIYLLENKIIMYDSFHSIGNREHINALSLFVQRAIEAQGLEAEFPGFGKDILITYSKVFPNQTDASSCGVFACKGMQTFYETLNENITWTEHISIHRDIMKKFYNKLFEEGTQW